MNQVFLYGVLAADPIVREVTVREEQAKVASFLLAVRRSDRQADYVPVTAWRRLADYVAGFKKGQQLLVRGLLRAERPPQGQPRRVDVVAVEIRAPRNSGNAGEASEATPASRSASAVRRPAAAPNSAPAARRLPV